MLLIDLWCVVALNYSLNTQTEYVRQIIYIYIYMYMKIGLFNLLVASFPGPTQLFFVCVQGEPGNEANSLVWGSLRLTPIMQLFYLACTTIYILCLPEQTTPASSECRQLCWPRGRWAQSISRDSDPLQVTSSRSIRPVPSPKNAPKRISAADVIATNLMMSLTSLIAPQDMKTLKAMDIKCIWVSAT